MGGDLPPLRGSSIRTKLAGAFILVALVSVLLVGLLVLGLIKLASAEIGRGTLRRQAEQFTAAKTRTGLIDLANDRGSIDGTKLRLYQLTSDRTLVPLTDGESISLSARQVFAINNGRLAEGTFDGSEGKTVFLARPAGRRGGASNVVVMTRPARIPGEFLSTVAGRLVLAAVIASAIAAAIGWLLATRISRPMRELANAAQDVAKGNFEARVAVESADEVGVVAGSFNRMAAELGEADRRQRDFFLSISHELRTPLTAIQGYAEAIEDGTASGSQRRTQAAGVIASESKRLTRLVSDLLDLARIDAKRFSISLEQVGLDGVLETVRNSFARKAQDLGVQIKVTSSGGSIPADHDRLVQVLSNLVENALRHTPSGKSIELAGHHEIGRSSISVLDGGPGFDRADLAKAFERQYLWEKYRGVRDVGTGLGLAITKEIVEAMGGRVEACNRDEGGAEFIIRFEG